MNYDNKTIEELLAIKKQLQEDPKSQNPDKKSIFKYSPKARKKLEELDWAITSKMREVREARGETIKCSGYSGRQSNKRR
jgi:hypothetical protein